MTDRTTPLYVVLNRSGDEFGECHRFLDGHPCRTVYLTTPGGLPALDQDGATEVHVRDSLAHDGLLPLVRKIADRHGTPEAVFGQSEYDILTAARLSDALGVPGGYVRDLVERFKDKPAMKNAVGAAGLRVPRFRRLDDTPAIADIGELEVEGVAVDGRQHAELAHEARLAAADAGPLAVGDLAMRSTTPVDNRDAHCRGGQQAADPRPPHSVRPARVTLQGFRKATECHASEVRRPSASCVLWSRGPPR
ncbi:hypothetical protein [Streptomyces sp. AGS-58]|uniref:hypothetical protein n=1 Tax=unclassified Streptomyces TaxID=2593676 RepID=UPI0035A3D001